jgi:autotransporter-associated beta strand protein
MSGGSATFSLTTDSVIPSPIQGNIGVGGGSTGGGLTTTGPATLTLTGDNTYSGVTTVQGGVLLFSGSVITPVVVNGGTLGANGTIAIDQTGFIPNSGNLTNNGGTVNPAYTGIGTLHVQGNYVQGPGGTFETEIMPSSNDVLQIDGNAMLDGTLILDPQGNLIAGTKVKILTTGGAVSGTFPFVNSPSFLSVVYGPNFVEVDVLQSSFFNNQKIPDGNPGRVADYIQSGLIIEPGSDFAFVLGVLGHLSDPQLKKALQQLHPAPFGTFDWISLNNVGLISSLISQHIFNICCSPCSASKSCMEGSTSESCTEGRSISECCADRHNNFWVQPFGEWTEHGKLGQLVGFSSEGTGVLLGYDHCFNHFMVGVAAGYTYADLDLHSSLGGGHLNRVYGGFYAGYFHSIFGADVALFGGGDFYKMHRRISFHSTSPTESVHRKAKSSHEGWNLFPHLGLSLDFECWHVPLFISATADYLYVKQDGFKERGADSLNLRVSEHEDNMLRTELSVNFRKTFKDRDRGICYRPYIGVGWVSKLPLSKGSFRSRFDDQEKAFSVVTTIQGINQVAPQAGISVASDNGLNFSAGAMSELNGRFRHTYVDLSLGYAF